MSPGEVDEWESEVVFLGQVRTLHGVKETESACFEDTRLADGGRPFGLNLLPDLDGYDGVPHCILHGSNNQG